MIKKQLFLNAVILSVTSFFLKFCTMTFKVYLSNKLGPEGIGLYQLIITVFGFSISLSCAGVQTAVTKTLSEQNAYGKQSNSDYIMKTALKYVLFVSLIILCLVFLASRTISYNFIRNPNSLNALKILSLAVLPVAISCCIKGFFASNQKIYLISISQIVEDCLKIAIVITVFNCFIFEKIETMCLVICLSVLFSEIVSCVFLLFFYIKTKYKSKSITKKNKNLKKQFYFLVATLGLGSVIGSLMHTIENFLIPIQLNKYGFNAKIALSHYGMIKGMAIPILCFPVALISTVASLLLPEITRLNSVGNKKRAGDVVEKSIKITLIISVFVMGVFAIFSDQIGILIYKNRIIGRFLFHLSFFVPFMYLDGLLFSFLTALDMQKFVFRISVIDAILRVVLTYFLVPIYGVNGIIIVMYISNLLTPACTFLCLSSSISVNVKISDILAPFAALYFSAKIYNFLKHKFLVENLFLEIVSGSVLILLIYLVLLTIIILCKLTSIKKKS